MQVRLISKTTGAIGTEYESKSLDEITVGIARLSSSREINELFNEPYKLIRHCLLNGHWSIFATTNLVFEIITSRAMGRELLRHYSIRPQELSQRYAQITEFEEGVDSCILDCPMLATAVAPKIWENVDVSIIDFGKVVSAAKFFLNQEKNSIIKEEKKPYKKRYDKK